jgi:hypothetical protein
MSDENTPNQGQRPAPCRRAAVRTSLSRIRGRGGAGAGVRAGIGVGSVRGSALKPTPPGHPRPPNRAGQAPDRRGG